MKTQHNQNHAPRRSGGAPSAPRRESTEPISAPYNFVPLATWVYFPEWAPLVSQDVPVEDGLSGVLDVTLTAHTPILCADEPRPGNAHQAGEAAFIKSGDRYLIPGSTLKGMVRDVVEILSYGRMRAVDDRRFALRDLSGKKVPYGQIARDVRAGFLEKGKDNIARLVPCEFVWLPHASLRDYLKRPVEEPLNRMFDKEKHGAVSGKYKRWKQLCEAAGRQPDKISFDIGSEEIKGRDEKVIGRRRTAVSLGEGKHVGVPVLTGQVSDGTQKRSFKCRDFVFYNANEAAAQSLEKREWLDFLFTHGDEDDDDEVAEGKAAEGSDRSMSWPGYWRARYFRGERVPVFYVKRKWGKAIGLAYMPRLAGDWSTHDLIRAVAPAHLDEPGDPGAPEYDLAELMFGTLGKCQEASLASRVLFEPAFAEGSPKAISAGPTVLNSPKPSYFPNYLVQPNPNERYRTYVDLAGTGIPPTLRGRKRYPVRNPAQVNVPPPPADSKGTVQIKLHPLPKNTRFTGRIVFHNLKPAELGALLWGLTLGDARHRHALGVGKPFGYGQLSISVTRAHIEPHDGSPPSPTAEYAEAFSLLMELGCKQNGLPGWLASDAIRLFLAMSDPDNAETADNGARKSGFPGELRHMRLAPTNEFVNAKQKGMALQPYLSGIVLRETAKAGIPQQAAPRQTGAPKPATPKLIPEYPKKALIQNATLTYAAGSGILEACGQLDGKLVRCAFSKADLVALSSAHPQWWEKTKKLRKGVADVLVMIEGAQFIRPLLEGFTPK